MKPLRSVARTTPTRRGERQWQGSLSLPTHAPPSPYGATLTTFASLRNLAEVLEEAIGRRPAILGRQGGDEFVILLPGIDLKDAVTISEDVCEGCEARALVQQEPAAKFTISVGVGTGSSGT